MKAITKRPQKPDVTLVMSWEEAKAIADKLGSGHNSEGPLYDLFYVLDDIINDQKLESKHP